MKHVGKSSTRRKNFCFIEDKEKQVQEIDFESDVEGWNYVKKAKVKFETETQERVTEKETSIRDKQMDEKGVFMLMRSETRDVFATNVLSSEYSDPEVMEAMTDELSKWKTFEAYEVVKDEGQERINGRWVVTRKDSHDGLKVNVKARFCLRGFKEPEKPRSDSPTVDRLSTKIMYAIAANEAWEMASVDVTSAFLQGNEIERERYLSSLQKRQILRVICG